MLNDKCNNNRSKCIIKILKKIYVHKIKKDNKYLTLRIKKPYYFRQNQITKNNK